MIPRAATLVVRLARWAERHKTAGAMLGMIGMLVIGSGYIAVDVVGVRPLHTTYTVRVQLHSSGGLLPHSNVTVRGVRVGKVESLELQRRSGQSLADVTFSLDSEYGVGDRTRLAVKYQSLTGLRYLDITDPTETAGAAADLGRSSRCRQRR